MRIIALKTSMIARRIGRSVPDALKRPENVVLVVWCALVVAFASARRDFNGDGLRHLPHVLSSTHPALGEPRWLLFPTLLFTTVRPFVLAGIVRDVESATRPFLALSVASGIIYLLSLRTLLVALGIESSRRGAALALAGAAAPLLVYSSDITEPLAAASVAVAGLAFAATQAHEPQHARKGVLVAVTAIALASLIYQGVLLAIMLLPCVVPPRTLLERRTSIGAVAILGMVPATLMAVLMIEGNSAGHALERLLFGEENQLFRSFLKSPSLSAYPVALLAGPPQGIIPIPNFSGVRGVIGMLRDPPVAIAGAFAIAIFAFCLFLIMAGVVSTIGRRDWALLVGFGGILILPLVRHQQYAYLKFYVLLPAVLALAAARISPGRVAAAAVIVATINGMAIAADIERGRALYTDMAPVYSHAGARACWVTSGWGPPLEFKWPGTTCALLLTLATGRGEDPVSLIRGQHGLLTGCLEQCFCEAASVLTDDMTVQSRARIRWVAGYFGFTAVDLDSVLWRSGSGHMVLGRDAPAVLTYSEPEQKKICEQLRAGSAVRTGFLASHEW